MQDTICEGQDYKFRVTLNYSFNIFNSENITCRINCEAIFPILLNITLYTANVWPFNRLGDLVGKPSNIFFSRLRFTSYDKA